MAVKVFDEDKTDNAPQQDESNLPEALKGKSTSEIFEMLRQEHEKEINQLKAEKFDQLDKGKGKGSQPATPLTTGRGPVSQPQYQPGPVSYQPQRQEEEPDIFSNPDGFMDRQFQKRLGPLVQSQAAAMRNTNREIFKGRIGGEYEKYGEEVEQFVSALAPQLQADPRAYEQAYNFVRASHLDEIVQEKTETKAAEKLAATLAEAGLEPDRIAEIVSRANGSSGNAAGELVSTGSLFQPTTGVPRTASATPRGDAPPRVGAAGKGRLSSEELKMMEEFGMTREEYVQYKAENSDTFSVLRGE